MITDSQQIKAKLQSIQKLGAYFRAHFPDWKIILFQPQWQKQEDNFIRKIIHFGGGQELARAEVVVPTSTFLHFQTEFENLGERSIGDHFLFVRPDVIRTPFEIFETKSGQWARRSQFQVEGFPLTITEYFSPEGLQCLLA